MAALRRASLGRKRAGSFSSAAMAWAGMVSPECSTTSRRIRFSSSRTLPGQRWRRRISSAVIVERLGRQAFVLGLAQEMARQVGNILDALAQGRQAQRHHIEPVIEVFAEQALGDQLAQIAVGGGDDAHIGA